MFSVVIPHRNFATICKFMSLICIYLEIVFIMSLAIRPNPAIGKCFLSSLLSCTRRFALRFVVAVYSLYYSLQAFTFTKSLSEIQLLDQVIDVVRVINYPWPSPIHQVRIIDIVFV